MAIPTFDPDDILALPDAATDMDDWLVEPDRAVLLIHDLQSHPLDALTKGGAPLVQSLTNIGRLKRDCARFRIPVIYSARTGRQGSAEWGIQEDVRNHGTPESPQAKVIVDSIAPTAGDIVIPTWTHSAFARTDLADRMARSCRDQLILVGFCPRTGITTTACDAWMRNIEPFIVSDAIAGDPADNDAMTLPWAEANCPVTTTDEIFAGLDFEGW
ncbi:isochorismatase family protein [Streptomyces sp. AV19]|uniref:isochorismatase family protein n=1 Tax=Streptomyces sp. AV19 TaxID=2793068 RepID=UPI0018FE2460|nr:isochorismatase family protein [Streptomyces sp. AV19]MBH1939177.1 isochorismatase family protein [Streptomyces sp. AV19]MDG4536907.1 isochorismatase family protein [Streptomyces sp. AV19]